MVLLLVFAGGAAAIAAVWIEWRHREAQRELAAQALMASLQPRQRLASCVEPGWLATANRSREHRRVSLSEVSDAELELAGVRPPARVASLRPQYCNAKSGDVRCAFPAASAPRRRRPRRQTQRPRRISAVVQRQPSPSPFDAARIAFKAAAPVALERPTMPGRMVRAEDYREAPPLPWDPRDTRQNHVAPGVSPRLAAAAGERLHSAVTVPRMAAVKQPRAARARLATIPDNSLERHAALGDMAGANDTSRFRRSDEPVDARPEPGARIAALLDEALLQRAPEAQPRGAGEVDVLWELPRAVPTLVLPPPPPRRARRAVGHS